MAVNVICGVVLFSLLYHLYHGSITALLSRVTTTLKAGIRVMRVSQECHEAEAVFSFRTRLFWLICFLEFSTISFHGHRYKLL